MHSYGGKNGTNKDPLEQLVEFENDIHYQEYADDDQPEYVHIKEICPSCYLPPMELYIPEMVKIRGG